MTVAAIILAAGQSSRFEDGHKLLAQLDGIPVIRHVVRALDQSNVGDIILVTGTNSKDIIAAAGMGRWRSVENSKPSEGLSASLRVGIETIDSSADGLLVTLADMPGISTDLINALLMAFDESEKQSIVFPTAADGKRGHPVIWPRALFHELSALSGDTGGKTVLSSHSGLWKPVLYDNAGAFADIDTRADLTDFPATRKLS